MGGSGEDDRAILPVFNIAMLTIVGILASAWILYFTEFFPVVTGLLGLGGLFAWVAFLLNILPKERKDSISSLFDAYCLQSGLFLILFFAAAAVLALSIVPSYGTILIDNLEARESRVVEISRREQDGKLTKLMRVPIPAASRVKVLVGTEWFGSGEYYLRPNGLPATFVTARWKTREMVDLPYFFTKKPAILVRPDVCLVGILKGQGADLLTIQVQKVAGSSAPEEIAREPYGGGAAWVGCHKDVAIPAETVDRWRLEFKLGGLDERGVLNWTTPVALAPRAEIGGSKIIVNILRETGEVAFHAEQKVPNEIKQFPQEIVLPCANIDSL